MSTTAVQEKKLLPKTDISKYESIPLYFYTEKDTLNRITVLKERSKESYLVAGRYTVANNEGRFYKPLRGEERTEVEKQLRSSRKEAIIIFL